MEEVKLIPNVEFIESLASDQHKYVQDDGMVEIVYEQKTRESKKNINNVLSSYLDRKVSSHFVE